MEMTKRWNRWWPFFHRVIACWAAPFGACGVRSSWPVERWSVGAAVGAETRSCAATAAAAAAASPTTTANASSRRSRESLFSVDRGRSAVMAVTTVKALTDHACASSLREILK
ncbi:hypothetical protein CVN56_26340 [Rhodococcus sp. AQ5-07]|nr:hypothetical protein CVN56_26340 [Rhodococcus sp. AQ5-07]